MNGYLINDMRRRKYNETSENEEGEVLAAADVNQEYAYDDDDKDSVAVLAVKLSPKINYEINYDDDNDDDHDNDEDDQHYAYNLNSKSNRRKQSKPIRLVLFPRHLVNFLSFDHWIFSK